MSNATINVSDWLSALLGPVEIQADTVPVAARPNLNFGPGISVNDDGETITFDATGGAPAGVDGDLQKKTGSAFTAAHLKDDGTCLVGSLPYCTGTGGYIGFNATGPGLLPSQGDLRFPTTAKAYLDSGGDVCLFDSDGASLFFGSNLSSGAQHVSVGLYGSSGAAMGVGATTYFYAQGGLCQVSQPLVGMSSANSPYGAVDGEAVIAMSGATHDLTAAEYAMGSARVTGTGTNIIRYPIGGAGSGAFFKHVTNAGSGTLSVRDVNGTTPSATLAAGTSAWFKFYNDGAQRVKQVTASFTPL